MYLHKQKETLALLWLEDFQDCCLLLNFVLSACILCLYFVLKKKKGKKGKESLLLSMLALSPLFFSLLGDIWSKLLSVSFSLINLLVWFVLKWLYKRAFVTQMCALCASWDIQSKWTASCAAVTLTHNYSSDLKSVRQFPKLFSDHLCWKRNTHLASEVNSLKHWTKRQSFAWLGGVRYVGIPSFLSPEWEGQLKFNRCIMKVSGFLCSQNTFLYSTKHPPELHVVL